MTKPSSKRLLLVCRKPPYGNALARESVEIALAAAVFDQNLAIAFIDDGVWQLQDQQNPEQLELKSQQKLLSALPLYGVEHIYADADALRQRAISPTDLAVKAQLLAPKALAELFNDADMIVNI